MAKLFKVKYEIKMMVLAEDQEDAVNTADAKLEEHLKRGRRFLTHAPTQVMEVTRKDQVSRAWRKERPYSMQRPSEPGTCDEIASRMAVGPGSTPQSPAGRRVLPG